MIEEQNEQEQVEDLVPEAEEIDFAGVEDVEFVQRPLAPAGVYFPGKIEEAGPHRSGKGVSSIKMRCTIAGESDYTGTTFFYHANYAGGKIGREQGRRTMKPLVEAVGKSIDEKFNPNDIAADLLGLDGVLYFKFKHEVRKDKQGNVVTDDDGKPMKNLSVVDVSNGPPQKGKVFGDQPKAHTERATPPAQASAPAPAAVTPPPPKPAPFPVAKPPAAPPGAAPKRAPPPPPPPKGKTAQA